MIENFRFTPPARKQFISAFRYIKSNNPTAAYNLRESVYEAFGNVKTFPDMGRIVPEFPELEFREIIVKPYRFFYDVVGDTIWIVGVWHSAQIPDEPSREN